MTVFGLNKERAHRPKRKREEASLQSQLVKDLASILPKNAFAFAVPNGGRRDPIEAANLRRQGVIAGVPDFVIIYDGKPFGLELKSKEGTLSPSQRATFPLLQNAGMRIEVARSLPEAVERMKEMGIPLRFVESDRFGARDAFRDASKRRPA